MGMELIVWAPTLMCIEKKKTEIHFSGIKNCESIAKVFETFSVHLIKRKW